MLKEIGWDKNFSRKGGETMQLGISTNYAQKSNQPNFKGKIEFVKKLKQLEKASFGQFITENLPKEAGVIEILLGTIKKAKQTILVNSEPIPGTNNAAYTATNKKGDVIATKTYPAFDKAGDKACVYLELLREAAGKIQNDKVKQLVKRYKNR